MAVNLDRLILFLVGALVWAMLDIWNGKQANIELWMLAGLVTSWLNEKRRT